MAGGFRADGPRLPIEFSRVSLDGRVTLVIDPRAQAIPTAWAPLAVSHVEAAIEGLGVREKIAPERRADWIGLEVRGEPSRAGGQTEAALRAPIVEWLAARSELDAVVWTALPARGPDGVSLLPDPDVLLAHLDALEGVARARAEEYVRRAPDFVRTANRTRFEQRFGWTPARRPPEPRQSPIPVPEPSAPGGTSDGRSAERVPAGRA
ncbi:MAG: hypothetical protein R3E53_11255 [Myxococcota bacterium]